MDNAANSDTHIYLYGIVPADVQMPLLAGIDVAYPLYGIVEHTIQAVVSQVRPSIFAVKPDEPDKNQTLARLVMIHESIVSSLLAVDTVLPAGFGTVLRDDTVARALVKQRAGDWQKMLHVLDGCVEMSVQASVDETVLSKERELAAAFLPAASSGANYLVQRARQATDKTRLMQHVTQTLTDLHEQCTKLAREQQLQSIDAGATDEEGRKVHMRACYLVEREKVMALKRLVKRHSKPSWLYLAFSKPYAPYHFAGKL